MAALNFRRPLAFNVGEDGDDFLVGQHAVIDRHGVGIGLAEHTRDPVFGDRDQIGVTMVPGMAAGVVGGRTGACALPPAPRCDMQGLPDDRR